MAKAIGIDLGTTFSAMAVMEAGKAVIIPNSEGDRTTPSVVLMKENETLVGKHAKNQAVVDPKSTIRSIKRHMGDKDFKVNVQGKDYTPQQISAMVLQKLKRDAEAYLGHEVKDAVVTVPAYFNDAQRQATKDAGTIAGLNVLRIINEPTAAALAYGIDKSDAHTILVFDFGGGTFDVSVLEIDDGVFEVKATSGNNHLGGDDIDDVLINYMADEFKKEHGVDLREDKTAHQRLKDAAEKAKIELSSATTTNINLPFITATAAGPQHLTMELKRAKFEQLIEPIVEKLKEPTIQAMKDASLDKSQIDKVIFVGGSTRIPVVQDLVKGIVGKDGEKSVNPDEAVGLGAAIQAGVLSGDVKDVLLLDVTPLSLGIETLGGVFTKLIEKNTTIPTKKSQIFSTAQDNQNAVTIAVFQGERPMAQDNKALGNFDLTGIPPAPRGVPKVEVTFDIDANGILKVSAKDQGTGKEQQITVTNSSNLSEEEIERMKKEAEENAGKDKERAEMIETINEADNLAYNTRKMLDEFKDKVEESKLDELRKKIEALEAEKDKEEKDVAAIKKCIEELNTLMQQVSTELYQKAAEAQGAAGADGAGADAGPKEETVEGEKADEKK